MFSCIQKQLDSLQYHNTIEKVHMEHIVCKVGLCRLLQQSCFLSRHLDLWLWTSWALQAYDSRSWQAYEWALLLL